MGIQFGGVLVVDDTAVGAVGAARVRVELARAAHRAARPARHHEPPRRHVAPLPRARSRVPLRVRERRPVVRPHLRGADASRCSRARSRRSTTAPTSTSPDGSPAASRSTARRSTVDCIAMRDRSWGVRRAGRQPKVGYDHATASADDGFLSISVDRKGDDRILRGYLLRDGDVVEPGRRHPHASSATPSTARPHRDRGGRRARPDPARDRSAR